MGQSTKMNLRSYINSFFFWLAILLLSTAVSLLESEGNETSNISDVLGRTIRVDVLCDDFEDPEQCFWRGGSGRGKPKFMHVTTPDGGKIGSAGGLEIYPSYNNSDGNPNQDDLLTPEFAPKLGRKLTRENQPVFIVHVWLPPFDQWGDYYSFGFRHETFPENGNKYYPTIWLKYDKRAKQKSYFVFRIGTGVADDVYGGPIGQPGWWTLAIAFDRNGIGHYYACPGVTNPTEKNKVFDTTQFRTTNGTNNPFMDSVNYSFFSLGYPAKGNASPRFIIDDFEVWVVKDGRGEDELEREAL